MADKTSAYLLITTDQSVNPLNTPFPSIASALRDAERSVAVLAQELRHRFNAEGRLHTVFFCAHLTNIRGRTVEQHIQNIIPVGDQAFQVVSSFVNGEWNTTGTYLDPETWEPVSTDG